jgi:hypothetical protein
MGLDVQGLRLLRELRGTGVSFADTVMIGRQSFSELLNPSDLVETFGITEQEATAALAFKYIEPQLRLLGATRIESIDKSDYEQATILHDMNQPIPNRLKRSFSLLLESGSLEHIFNFPQAMKNCMEMVSVGGHFVGITVANNLMGHGFYQFSPELYYRVLSPENGFQVENMWLSETRRGARWYRVTDPKTLGYRVELANMRPTYMITVARRVGDTEIFKATPQQSDYMVRWGMANPVSASVAAKKRGAVELLAKLFPNSFKDSIREMILGGYSRRAFRSDAYREEGLEPPHQAGVK